MSYGQSVFGSRRLIHRKFVDFVGRLHVGIDVSYAVKLFEQFPEFLRTGVHLRIIVSEQIYVQVIARIHSGVRNYRTHGYSSGIQFSAFNIEFAFQFVAKYLRVYGSFIGIDKVYRSRQRSSAYVHTAYIHTCRKINRRRSYVGILLENVGYLVFDFGKGVVIGKISVVHHR